jgi:hypothetical protein
MGAIAEGLVFRMPAPAKTHDGSSAETEFLAFLIQNLKITFDANGTIVEYSQFSSSHEFPPEDEERVHCLKRLEDSW